MSKENKKEASKEVVIAGRRFNPEDPNVFDQIKQTFEPVARNAGKIAQENDSLKREIKQKRTYKLSGGSQDMGVVIGKVKELNENGASLDEINQVWADFHSSSVKEAQNGNQFDLMFKDYLELRPEVKRRFRDPLDEEIAKDVLKRNHLASLEANPEKQFEYLDQYFEGTLRSSREESNDVPSSTGSSFEDSYDASADKKEDKSPLSEEELDKKLMDDFLKTSLY